MNIDTYLISLKNRPDRRQASLLELKKLGINEEFIKIIDAQYTASNGAIGCANSHGFTLSKFLFESDADYCLILEDDFECIDEIVFKDSIKKILTSDVDWDVVLLASNMTVPLQATTIQNLFKVINAQTTSAYLVKRKFCPTLIKIFYESAYKNSESLKVLDNKTANHFFAIDMSWKQLQLQHNFLAFLPQLIRQRDSYSEIENKEVSYGV